MMKVNVDQMQNYAPDLFTKLENLEILKIELKCDWLSVYATYPFQTGLMSVTIERLGQFSNSETKK